MEIVIESILRKVFSGPSSYLRVPAAMSRNTRVLAWICVLVSLVFGAATLPAYGATPTTTMFDLTSGGASVTTIATVSVVTLTATLSPVSASVNPGQVRICDSAAVACTDVHLIATLQLTSGSSTSFKLLPGIGAHCYKAVFVGTNTHGASASSAIALTVTGPASATNAAPTTIASSGRPGNYALTATVTGSATAPPTRPVSFQDVDNGNYVLGTADLGVSSTGDSLVTASRFPTNSGPGAIVTADFNGNGLPDVATTSYDRSGLLVADAITILLGQAGGTFASSSTTSSGGVSRQSGDGGLQRGQHSGSDDRWLGWHDQRAAGSWRWDVPAGDRRGQRAGRECVWAGGG